MSDSEKKEVDLHEEFNEDSIFISSGRSCDKCGRAMDHSPIPLPDSRAYFERKNPQLPPVLSTTVTWVCRFCLVDAVAPIETPIEGKPNVGWWWLKCVNGELEPSGTKGSRKNRVGKEIPEDKTD